MLPCADIRLSVLLYLKSHGQEHFFGIFDASNSDSIVDIFWESKIKRFSVPFHAPSIPNLAKLSPCVFLIKQVSIDKLIVITVLLKVVGLDSDCQIDMVVFFIVIISSVSCHNYGMSLRDVIFNPLQIIFVLGFWGLIVPCLVLKPKLTHSLLTILPNQEL